MSPWEEHAGEPEETDGDQEPEGERESEEKQEIQSEGAPRDSWKAGIGKLGQRVTANSFSGIHEMVAAPVARPMSRI